MSEKGTEQATPQKKKKAREQGDFVHSRELLSAMAMLGGVLMLGIVAHSFVAGWQQAFDACVRTATAGDGPSEEMVWGRAARAMLAPVIVPIGLVLAASFAGALFSGLAQNGGVQVHANILELKLSRLNPVTNLENLFSLRTTARTFKSLVPAAAMGFLGWNALRALLIPMPVMSLVRLSSTFSTAYKLAFEAAWITLAWSALDYAVEWRSWNERLKMSKQELRDEARDTMGNPQIKAKIRQVQRAMRRRKVKADMSRASVVITNPTHYAVALEFDFETMAAPTVLAKGRDLHAAEIREEARWVGVPLVENPPLARSLYKMVEPGQSIPFELYAAVAGILAYLYRQKVAERVRREREEQQRAKSAPLPVAFAGMRGFGGGM